MFWYRIYFAVYTQMDESAIKNGSRRTLYQNTFESGGFVDDSLTNPDIFRLLSCTASESFGLPY